jgi:hypothetical protein
METDFEKGWNNDFRKSFRQSLKSAFISGEVFAVALAEC